MKVFFTADTHFGHSNIIKYANRPYKSIYEHDQALVDNWNSVVSPQDTVYHLGDFCFGAETTVEYFIRQLKFKTLIFVKGNHDRPFVKWFGGAVGLRFYYGRTIRAHNSYAEESILGQDFTLCHYAMKVWNKSHYGAYHLYGHSHGSLPDDPHSLSFDVGVDCHNYTPISFEQVKHIMSRKLFKPIDHHGRKKETGGIGLSKEDYAKEDRRRLFLQLSEEFKNE